MRKPIYWDIGMSKLRVLTGIVSVVVLLTFASSVSADPVHLPPGLEKFNLAEAQTFDFLNIDKPDIRALLSEHFANNNGKHLGFSVAATRPGLHFGLTKPRNPHSSVTQNPEPTGMLLLGTGLAAGAAFLRRRSRKRREAQR